MILHLPNAGLPLTRRERWGTVVLIALITGMTAIDQSASWYGSWGETGAALDKTTTITYPALAAVAAWFASAPGRRRFQGMVRASSRKPYSLPLHAVVSVGAYATLGTLVALAGMWTVTARTATFGRVPLLELVVVLCGYAAAAGFGLLVGSTLPSLIAPVAAVVVVYGTEYLADTGKPSLSPLAGLVVADSRERTYRETLIWVLGLRAFFLLAVALLFAALATRAASVWLLPFALVCATATPLLWVGDSGMKVDPAAMREVCDAHGTVSVCMTAARSHAAGQIYRVLAPDLRLLAGISPGKVVLVEETISTDLTATVRDGTLTVPFGVVNGVDGDAHRANARDLQVQFTSTLLRSNCKPNAASQASAAPRATAADVVQAWLLQKVGIPIDGSGGLGAPALLPGEVDYTGIEDFRTSWGAATNRQRQTWLTLHRDGLISCTLTATDLKL